MLQDNLAVISIPASQLAGIHCHPDREMIRINILDGLSGSHECSHEED